MFDWLDKRSEGKHAKCVRPRRRGVSSVGLTRPDAQGHDVDPVLACDVRRGHVALGAGR